MNFLDNITFRRTRVRTHSDSEIDDNNTISQTLECSANSMPDISDDEDDQVKKLRDEIKDLKIQLSCAQKEIELLSLENSKLKQTNTDLAKKNNSYELDAAISPAMTKQCSSNNILQIIQHSKQTQTDHSDCQISTENKQQDTISDIHRLQTRTNMTHSQVRGINIQSKNKYDTSVKVSSPGKYKPKKLCIVSANKQNKVLSISEETFKNKFNICHYLTPGGGIHELLKGIESKLIGYTMDDFCVIFIGEGDFIMSNNYAKLVIHIRKTLSAITHTNIIICLPTYKYSFHSNVYNWRIRHFNNLLYQNMYVHKFAYVFDSNAHVNYDHNTFYRHSGQINNFGIRNIFAGIFRFINDVMCSFCNNVNNNLIILTNHEPTHALEYEKQLFRV